MRGPAVALPVALLALGCAGDAPGTPDAEITTRVEDGVTIVENPGLHVADTLAWSVDTAAAVRIGVVDGPEEYVFGRLGGMSMRPDGTVLVADALAHDVRAFDAAGSFARRFGGEGEGPGELGDVTGLVALAGDSLAVLGNTSQRIDLFDPSLEFVRRFRVRLRDTRATPPYTTDKLENVFADGLPLLSDYVSCGQPAGTLCVDSVVFHRTDEEGRTLTKFGTFVHGRNETRRIEGVGNISWREPHPQAFWATHGDRFYYADAQRFEILVYGPDGALERRIRVAGDPPRYAQDEVVPPAPPPEPSGDPMMDRIRAGYQEAMRTAPLPDTLPAFSDLVVDGGGNIWVREYLPPGLTEERGPYRWFVFDPEGRLRWSLRSAPGMVRSPNPVRTLDPWFGRDRIVVAVRDELGVETVVVYPLRKRGVRQVP